jgi:hypothetical protein
LQLLDKDVDQLLQDSGVDLGAQRATNDTPPADNLVYKDILVDSCVQGAVKDAPAAGQFCLK